MGFMTYPHTQLIDVSLPDNKDRLVCACTVHTKGVRLFNPDPLALLRCVHNT